MNVYVAEGVQHSIVWCNTCKRNGKLTNIDTNGFVSQSTENALISKAINHEQRHPTHKVEVRIYKYAELPFIRECREIKESKKTDNEMTEEEATKRVLEIKQWLFTKGKMTQSS